MANVLGDLVYRITGDTSKLDKSTLKTDKEVKKLSNSMDKSKKSASGMTGAMGILSKALPIAAVIALGAKLFNLSKEFVNLRSIALETQNKFNVTFGDISATATATAASLAQTYKLANSEVQGLLSSTGDILTGFGFTQTKALDLSESVLKLSTDLASFQNIAGGAPEVVDRLTKALTGETEGLKPLGIVVRQDTKEFRALVKSIMDTTGASQQLAKSQAILQVAISQSKKCRRRFYRNTRQLPKCCKSKRKPNKKTRRINREVFIASFCRRSKSIK